MSDTVYLDGAYVPRSEARISPDDRGFVFADGVYEVVRSYGGRLFRLESHLDRLADGLGALRIEGIRAAEVASIAAGVLTANGLEDEDALVYVQITRGAAPRTHAFPDPAVAPTVFVAASPFTPRFDQTVGVAVITVPDVRWLRCDIKSVALLPNCLAAQEARDAGAAEAVLVRDGVALEGTATSLLGVFDGVVTTAPQSPLILPGISRDVVLELCEQHGVPVARRAIPHAELPDADELFLASTTLEVMPIVGVDGTPVGGGEPGPVTRRLAEGFGLYARGEDHPRVAQLAG